MKIKDSIKITGELRIIKYDANMNIILDMPVKNLVVTTGKILIASRLVGTTDTVPSDMAVGESGTGANLSDIALYAEKGRVTLFSTTWNTTDNFINYVATFPAGTATSTLVDGIGLKEAGIFNSTNIMLCRSTFPTVFKESTETLSIFWTLTIN